MKLCCKHRHLAQMSATQAELIWQRLVHLGREKIACQDWAAAVAMFGSAFETAEILLSQSGCQHPQELQRFEQSAMEFIYCLRHSHYTVDFDGLVEKIREKLEFESQHNEPFKAVESIMTPIVELAQQPLDEIDRFMTTRLVNMSPGARILH